MTVITSRSLSLFTQDGYLMEVVFFDEIQSSLILTTTVEAVDESVEIFDRVLAFKKYQINSRLE